MASHVLVDTDTIQTVSNKDLADCTITAPILSGTATGVYTLGGTPTISAPTITTPTVTGALAIAGQIVFPATQNASAGANTLDDYEEGTWTPSVGGTATYTSQAGKYTKIGNLVWINCSLQINAIGTGSANTISGLPFAPSATMALAVGITISLVTAVVSLRAHADVDSTISLAGRTAASTGSDTTLALIGSGTLLLISGCYAI